MVRVLHLRHEGKEGARTGVGENDGADGGCRLGKSGVAKELVVGDPVVFFGDIGGSFQRDGDGDDKDWEELMLEKLRMRE